MKLVFSIAVHEQPDVVINQIENFYKYNPGSSIILHVSKKFNKKYDSFLNSISNERLLINPLSLETGHADGSQLAIHLSNLCYIVDSKIPFNYFCISSSNELFIKNGLFDYVKNYECGSFLRIEEKNNWWAGIKHDKYFFKLKNKLPTNKSYASQVEGIFFNSITSFQIYSLFKDFNFNTYQSLINKILRKAIKYASKYIDIKVKPYPKEEFYFATVLGNICNSIGLPYCYMNWSNNLTISKDIILEIIDNPNKYENIFSVKRVERKIDDQVRVFINNLNN
jgi:hypothetical protein